MTARFAEHLLTGDHASRPAFGAVPQGALYSCTDHGLIYQSDGTTAWSTWEDPASGPPGAHTHAGEDIDSGTVADARIAAAIARDSEITAAVNALVAAAPGALDTLDELAAALGDDANFATTVTTALAGKQPLDADLTAIAALVSAADKLPYATGSGTWTLGDLTAAGRALLDDADAAAQRTTLGLGTAAVAATGDFDAAGAAAAVKGLSLALTGAVSATRYVGATVTGAPASGTFAVGDFIITHAGAIYICTAAGTPGTWAAVSGGGGGVTVTEPDGTSIASVDTLRFPNGTVTDLGSGDVDIRQVPTGFIGAKATEANVQSIADSTEVAFTLNDADIFDTDGFHDTGSNTSRLTVPAGMGGKYLVNAAIRYAANGTGMRGVMLAKNGTVFQYDRRPAMATFSNFMTTSAVVDLAAGEYVEVMAYQTSGGALDADVPGFSIVKLDSGKVGTGVGAKAYHSTTQAVLAAAEDVLLLDSEAFDTDGFHSTSVNTGRMTIPAGLGGKYLIIGRTHHDPDTASAPQVALTLYKNAAVALVGGGGGTSMAGAQDLQGNEIFVTVVEDLAAGDYVYMTGYTANNVSFGHAAATVLRTSLSIMRLDSVPVGAGTELDYVEKTSNTSITATVVASADVIVTGAAVVFDGRPVVLEFYSPNWSPASDAAGRQIYVRLFEDGADRCALAILANEVNGVVQYAHCHATFRFTPSAGTHTYSVRGVVSAGTGNVGGGSGSGSAYAPCFMRITKV